MKTINKYKFWIWGLFSFLMMTACAPMEDDSHILGGQLVNMPQSWNVSAVDNDNTVLINFDPLVMIDSINVFAVQFSCPEAGINFVVKDRTTTSYSKKVYSSGDYTLYVAAVTRAGTGTPREVPFTVVKNLLLERLSDTDLTETIQAARQAADPETLKTDGFYIEQNSIIELGGAFTSEDIVFNLDFFQRISSTQVRFLGASGVYNVYYHPDRKFVFLGLDTPTYPDCLVALGKNFSYPTKQALATYPFANYPENARYGDVLKYGLYRKVGDKQYQITVMLASGDGNLEFKAYFANSGAGAVTSGWGNGGEFRFSGCTFTGVPNVFAGASDGNNWVAGKNLDPTAIYRVIVSITNESDPKTANIDVQQVDFEGNVIPYIAPEEPGGTVDPNTPIVSDKFTIDNAVQQTIKDEKYSVMYYTLEKDKVYTLEGSMADTNLLYNVDFFERVNATSVKFLGESGNYRLYYNYVRRYVLIGIGPNFNQAKYPDYMILCGLGLGYPTKTPASVISFYYSGKDLYSTEWNTNTPMSFIIMRKTADRVFQATVLMAPQSWTSYKPFENTANWWDNGKPFSSLSFSGSNVVQQTGGSDDNWGATANVVEQHAYRIIMNLNNNTVTVNEFALP